jgi:outer membrane protein OmpA-like peptidoglycan-associated protein
VKAYLMGQGISSTRLAAFGKGESSPVDNSSTSGRRQNRRVEVIIGNLFVSSR